MPVTQKAIVAHVLPRRVQQAYQSYIERQTLLQLARLGALSTVVGGVILSLVSLSAGGAVTLLGAGVLGVAMSSKP